MRLLPFRTPRRLFPILLLTLLFLLASLFLRKIAFVQDAGNGLRARLYESGIWSRGFFSTFLSDKQALQRENNLLRTRVLSLALDEAQLARLRQEVKSLADLLNYSQQNTYTSITARVLSRSTERTGELLLIDRGSDSGVEVDGAVVAGDGVLIGRVDEVNTTTSIVRLITDRSSRFGARLLDDEDGTIGIAEGSDGTIIHIAYIPQDVMIDLNDVVVSSGLDASIPAGLVIGIVTQIVADEHDPFQTATVEPLIDLRELTMVSVLSLSP